MYIFRCAAPPVSILFDFSTKIIATLWLIFQVQRTGNLCRILSGSGVKGAAHRNIWCKVFQAFFPKSMQKEKDIIELTYNNPMD